MLIRFWTLTICLVLGGVFDSSAAEKPNFVVLIADDLSTFDTEPYGSRDIRTPQMRRLASEGMTFTHCFVASPSCCPSRTALLTGLWPARNGAEPNHKPKRDGVASLPPVLQALGYETAAFGKVAHGKDAALHGFDHIDPNSSVATVQTYLKQRDATKPLCLFLGTRHPHVPWSPNDGYQPDQLILPATHVDTPETRRIRCQYATDVTNADTWLGELYDLTRQSVKGDTLYLFTADHGSQWPFAKWNLYDAGIRVPFLVVWPGHLPPASQSDAMIAWPDLLPTFIDLAGGTVPPGLDGQSFAQVLRGTTTTHRTRIFSTHSGDGERMNVYPIRSLRTREWKYIRNLHPEYQHHSHISRGIGKDGLIYWTSWLKAAETDPAAKQLVTRHQVRPAEELYDLTKDPDELHNLATDPKHAERLAQLRAELTHWMKSQGDQETVFGQPLLIGEPATPITPAANQKKKAAPGTGQE